MNNYSYLNTVCNTSIMQN